MTYTIKPLEWEETEGQHNAFMPFCSFTVKEHGNEDEKWYYWNCCFEEFYDEDGGYIDTLADAKAKCEEIWIKRIKMALIEVPAA